MLAELARVEAGDMSCTYHRLLKGLRTLLEDLQCLALARSAFYDGWNGRLAHVLQNGLELIGGWWVFGDVQLELGAVRGCLCRVVAGLVFCGMLGGICRCLLEESGNTDRGRRAGLVEEGNNVLGLVLSAAQLSQQDKTF